MLKSVGIRKISNKCMKESHHSHVVKQISHALHDLHTAHTDTTRLALLPLTDLTVNAMIPVTLPFSGTT
jgi:hypothetical protein